MKPWQFVLGVAVLVTGVVVVQRFATKEFPRLPNLRGLSGQGSVEVPAQSVPVPATKFEEDVEKVRTGLNLVGELAAKVRESRKESLGD